MVDNELDGLLVERIARVRFAVDLADVASADIDAFLDHLEVEPFSDEQVERILGRIGLESPACSRPADDGPGKRSDFFSGRRTGRSKSPCYRLSCEELENRLPPSVYGAAAAGAGLDFGMTLAVVPASATVRLWEARHVMEVQGSATPLAASRSGDSAPGWEHGEEYSLSDHADLPNGNSAAGVSWEALFSELDCSSSVACELQLAG